MNAAPGSIEINTNNPIIQLSNFKFVLNLNKKYAAKIEKNGNIGVMKRVHLANNNAFGRRKIKKEKIRMKNEELNLVDRNNLKDRERSPRLPKMNIGQPRA